MAQVTHPRIYKPRTRAEMELALAKVLKHQQTYHIPPQESDEDIVLSDAIDELLELRKQVEQKAILEGLSYEAKLALAALLTRALAPRKGGALLDVINEQMMAKTGGQWNQVVFEILYQQIRRELEALAKELL